MDKMKRILLVEDDSMIASGLLYALEQEGYIAVHCKDVQSAYHILQTNQFDLALLDMQLPDGTGFDVSQKMRDTATAIIFITIEDDEGKVLRAFEGGAADYITKPFRLREVLARVKRTLHEGGDTKQSSILSIGKATIDTLRGKVRVSDMPIELTALEYRLLLTFASNKTRLLTRTQILESIWDCDSNFVEDNTLTVYIKRLREKLGDAVTIETIRGIGYRAD